ncbi:potassium channel subfamily K member 13 [Latimeria chalumnae]|nr:PREDICTED: potassium channel subfamily K member 13 [Latimeria chalumnae]|eukprot:XP_005992766.1 PREDICTED: potassium channel subfamily K member 13 [Latimeria chalumnae]
MAGRSGRCCCCTIRHSNEDNARFFLLALLIVLYLLLGAAVFSALEHPKEREVKGQWEEHLENFTQRHNLSWTDLQRLLRDFEDATVAGVHVDDARPRWDFTGAFYFVGTVVSTIGFGMTTPATVGGKVFLIFYGLIGCSGTILFFNLFLERLITMLAFILKTCHEHQLRRKGVFPHDHRRRGSGMSDGEESLAGWKPSVYYVMLILCMASVIISCCASAMFAPMEGWSYFDSLYFCFVAFSTIGFGDLVSSQGSQYENQGLYRFGNFIFILMGVCCIYSLFNVISIVIKQLLNWILRKLECQRCHLCPRKLLRSRRNVVMPGHIRSHCNVSIETDGVNEGDTDGRRMSGEMISMKDFLASNKVSLAIMQKQLSETANGNPRQMGHGARHNEFSGGVGALAIMNNRLAETSMDR